MSAWLALSCALACHVQAGGSGLNTVVVINQNSADSRELGNYYCERRQVPPENVLRIIWPGGNTSWSSADFQTTLLTPLLEMLTSRQLTNQVVYVVLSMDIPFQTVYGAKVNGTTSALFYGLKDDTGANWKDVTNSYCASEQPFQQAKPASAPGYSFLATMLTAGSLAQARQLVDQGVASDRTWPLQPAILAKTSDPLRNIRYRAFDNAIFNTRLQVHPPLVRTQADSPGSQTNLLGYATGLAQFSLSPNAFIPGAMADSMDSFGGIIFGPNDHTSLLAFIKAGAAGSYGTVTEPTPNVQKFPNPQNYFYQGRGFSLAECYYQSLYIPFQGLVVAEPLAAPFTRAASGSWAGAAANSVLSGTPQLGVAFSGTDQNHLLQQIDLFIDGKFWQTLTNCAPRPGNVLNVTLNGYPFSYAVPTNATLATVANQLATLLNAPATTNLTRIAAQAYGDRVELRSLASNSLAIPFFFADSGATNPAGRYYRAQYLSDTVRPWLAGLGRTNGGAFHLHLETPAGMPSFVQASTDLVTWTTILTNLVGGPLDVVDPAAGGYSRRFYRIVQTPSEPRPQLAPLSFGNGAGFRLRALTASTTPCVLQASTNLVDWTSIYTNSLGGMADFVDAGATNTARRFYRALACPPTSSLPALSVQTSTNANGTLVRVEGAVQPFVILRSADQVQWTPVCTNFAAGQVQTVVSSSLGGADVLTTSLTASRGTFLDSVANGLRTFNVTGTIALGAWLQLNVTKTNGVVIGVSVTNLSGSATLYDLAQQLATAINSSPALQGGDGLVAEDLATGTFGTASFNLRARGSGRDAAAIQVRLITSTSLGASPSALMRLDANLSDLYPRNHLYVAAGASQLASSFPLDTTRLADGFHELTAVAYEGTHVRTQTRITLPVQIRNTSLSASLTLLDVADPATAQGTYHIEVAANTNNVSAISLFSTGGLLNTVANQSVATFTIDGSALGAGLHPFYAQVQTSSGAQYRTPVRWVRLVNPQ